MTLDIGDTQTLQYQFSPAQSNPAATASFTSSNPSVATVDLYGKVTAISAGTATITATTNYWTSATCEVTVNPMLATFISLNQTSMNLSVGSTQQLTATVLPANASNKSVTWTSSDESIATVDAIGNVTGVGTGYAIITATTDDGSNLSASCAVTVTGIPAISIHIDKTEVEMDKGQSIKLTATVLPAGASQRVTWSSSDPSVARVVGGTVYAQDMGECLITARTLDGSNLTADCLIMVYPEGGQHGGVSGDVDGDGKITIADVTSLINYLLDGTW